jgi:nitrate/nitrite transporter NarK
MGVVLIGAMRAAHAGLAIGLLIAASWSVLLLGTCSRFFSRVHQRKQLEPGLGAEDFAGNLAGIITPVAVAFLITSYGSYLPGFELAEIIVLAGVLAYWFVVGDWQRRDSTGSQS